METKRGVLPRDRSIHEIQGESIKFLGGIKSPRMPPRINARRTTQNDPETRNRRKNEMVKLKNAKNKTRIKQDSIKTPAH